MRKSILYIVSALTAIGCTERIDMQPLPSSPEKDPAVISMSCSMGRTMFGGETSIQTRSVIGKPIWEGLECNFIKIEETRINEETPEDYEYDQTYIRLENATIVNASVSTADNTTTSTQAGYDYLFREIRMNPALSYQFNVPVGEVPTEANVTGYASAMVGWYPATEDVSVAGTGSNTLFRDTQSYSEKDGKVCVTFKNKLDGETDIMVSDLREGRFNKKSVGFRNNAGDRDIQPFGYEWVDFNDFSKGFNYRNYFTFRHYLTAVRLFLSVSDANLSLLSWGRITDVVFINQPSTAVVELPVEQALGNSSTSGAVQPVDGTTPSLPCEGVEPIYGEVIEWADPRDIKIKRTPIVEEDPDYPELNSQTPVYPIVPGYGSSMEATYLGYCLIQPEHEATIEIHTDAGIIVLKIPTIADYIDNDGNTVTTDILKEGYIYDLNLIVNTQGNIEIVVGNRDDKKFRDLAPFNEKINAFEDSNCYVISKDLMTDNEGNRYNGFYFHAYTPGRGQKGAVASAPYPGDMIFTPTHMEILWQDENRPITDIQFINGYCRFTLNDKCYDETDPLEGNAVLAAYDEDDNVIWSWHIWITSQIKDLAYTNVNFRSYENCAADAVKGDLDLSNTFYENNISGRENRSISFSMMNMNLGATQASWTGAGDVLKTYGLYYQWGRKDPSIGPPAYDYNLKSLSTARYLTNNGWSDTVYEHLENYPDIESGIRTPLALIDPMMLNGDYHNDWMYISDNSLWGYDDVQKKVTNKTIYDPCPYGYRVADEELNALFYAARRGYYNYWNTTYGAIVDGNNYFPYTGWKGHIKGRSDRTHAWFNVGSIADYQDARISHFTTTEYFGYKLHRGASIIAAKDISILYSGSNYFKYSAGFSPTYANRTTAAPVRCVRYNADDEEPAR